MAVHYLRKLQCYQWLTIDLFDDLLSVLPQLKKPLVYSGGSLAKCTRPSQTSTRRNIWLNVVLLVLVVTDFRLSEVFSWLFPPLMVLSTSSLLAHVANSNNDYCSLEVRCHLGILTNLMPTTSGFFKHENFNWETLAGKPYYSFNMACGQDSAGWLFLRWTPSNRRETMAGKYAVYCHDCGVILKGGTMAPQHSMPLETTHLSLEATLWLDARYCKNQLHFALYITFFDD